MLNERADGAAGANGEETAGAGEELLLPSPPESPPMEKPVKLRDAGIDGCAGVSAAADAVKGAASDEMAGAASERPNERGGALGAAAVGAGCLVALLAEFAVGPRPDACRKKTTEAALVAGRWVL